MSIFDKFKIVVMTPEEELKALDMGISSIKDGIVYATDGKGKLYLYPVESLTRKGDE